MKPVGVTRSPALRLDWRFGRWLALAALAIATPAHAATLDLQQILSKLPGAQKVGVALPRAAIQNLSRGLPFGVYFPPGLTIGQLRALIQKRMTPGVLPGAPPSRPRPDGIVDEPAAPAAVPTVMVVPASYNFYTAAETRRCLMDGPMDQFGGTCWAHAAAAAVTGAACKARIDAPEGVVPPASWVSPQHIVTCNDRTHLNDDFRSMGGTPYGDGYRANTAIENFIATGTPFVDFGACAPLRGCGFCEGGTCGSATTPGRESTCISAPGLFPRCTSVWSPTCDGTDGPPADPIRVQGVVSIPGGAGVVGRMQAAILKHGPILVSIEAFDDLSVYASGIYRHDKPARGWSTNHAVVVYGWGADGENRYWLVQNSWGKDYGVKVNGDAIPRSWDWLVHSPSSEGGFVKVALGENMIAIESYPYYVKAGPAIDHRDVTLTLGQVTGNSARIEPRPGANDRVALASLTKNRGENGQLKLDFYLPEELLTPATARPRKRVVSRAALRLYLQRCQASPTDAGAVRIAYQNTLVSCGKGNEVQVELDVTDAVQRALRSAPPAGSYPVVSLKVEAAEGSSLVILVPKNMSATLLPAGQTAYTWPPALRGVNVKPAPGAQSGDWTFPRLHLELREATTERDLRSDPVVNLAQGAIARQSSLYGDGVPYRAIDGDRGGSRVTHTQDGPGEWLEIDLQGTQEIRSVAVYNRTDCCSDRWYPVNLEISSSACDQPRRAILHQARLVPPGTSPDRSMMEVTPPSPIQARYVCLRQPDNVRQFLSVAEVQVQGVRRQNPPASLHIVNALRPLCLGVAGEDYHTPGAPVEVWDCDTVPGQDQRWVKLGMVGGSFRIFNRLNTLCLRVTGGRNQALGARAVVDLCNASDGSDEWMIGNASDGRVQIKNKASGMCLGVAGPDTFTRGGAVEVWDCATPGQDAYWRLRDAP